jgi:hypothetical protein
VRGRHLGQRGPHILHGQVLQWDPADDGQQRPQRIPVNLNRLGGAARQPLGQPVSHGLLDRVAVRGPDARVKLGVQLLELVLDLGPGRAADLLADPLPARGEAR